MDGPKTVLDVPPKGVVFFLHHLGWETRTCPKIAKKCKKSFPENGIFVLISVTSQIRVGLMEVEPPFVTKKSRV